jgi:hypothetical protein
LPCQSDNNFGLGAFANEAYDHGAAALGYPRAELTANGRHMTSHDDGTSAQQNKQQPKELLFVLALATVNVDDACAETLSISTSSLVCSSQRRSAKKFLQ